MVVRREARDVARARLHGQHVDHEPRAAPDAPESALLRRHVEVVGTDPVAVHGRGPWRVRRDVRVGGRVGGGVHAALHEVLAARTEHADDLARLLDRDRAPARRHDDERVPGDLAGLLRRRDRDLDTCIRHEQEVFIDVVVARKPCAFARLGVAHDEILAARIPAALVRGRLPRRRVVELHVLRGRESQRRVRRRVRRGSARTLAQFRSGILCTVHRLHLTLVRAASPRSLVVGLLSVSVAAGRNAPAQTGRFRGPGPPAAR